MSLRVQRIDNKPAVVNEEGTLRITGTFQDDHGVAIPGSALLTCTLELYDVETDTTINDRDAVDISALVDEEGGLDLVLLPADNPIVTPGVAGTRERHVALVRWTFDTDKGDSEVIEIDVIQIHRIPAA